MDREGKEGWLNIDPIERMRTQSPKVGQNHAYSAVDKVLFIRGCL